MRGGKSVIIIGAGVVGLCAAYYAAEAGHQVTILERGGPDHDCCSLGNAGMVVPSHFVPLAAPGMVLYGLRTLLRPGGPFGISSHFSPDLLDWGLKLCKASTRERSEKAAPLLLELNLASRKAYEELAEATGNRFALVKRGLLMLCKSQHSLEEETATARAARRLGLPAEVLRPEEIAQLEPGVRMEIAGGVYFPQDCHLNPTLLMAALQRELESRQVRFLWGTACEGWRIRGDRVDAVVAGGEDHRADEYVVAGGAWAAGIVRPLGRRLPLQAGKGYSITLPRPPRIPRICSILAEARVAVTPLGESLRFGGTMEIGENDLRINRTRVRGLIDSIPGYFPEFGSGDFKGIPVWSGLRPCSPDGLPYIGRLGGISNVIAATGHAMMGVSLAPVTGKIVAAILSDETPLHDLRLLNPDRYV